MRAGKQRVREGYITVIFGRERGHSRAFTDSGFGAFRDSGYLDFRALVEFQKSLDLEFASFRVFEFGD